MLSLREIPEDENLQVIGGNASPTIVPTAVHRDVGVEVALRLVQTQHPASEVRIRN